jgi:lipopolysaccharide/colanic/teichoic acid biosynthesis glycosyltransferase
VDELDLPGETLESCSSHDIAPPEIAPPEIAPRRRRQIPRAFVCEAPSHRNYVIVKVCVEWTLAAVLLLLTSPLVAFLAAMVKLTSSGPAFYSQTRLGLNGRAYRILKLRTMQNNCEAKTGPVWAKKNDSRITPIGKLLRDTHLDELPQLWNVLRGEMALIGPRPERPEIVRRLYETVPNYGARMYVRPGVTGLAQMRLPADSDLEGVQRKVAHDLYYVRKVGLLLDIRIALSTVFYFTAAAAHGACRSLVGSYGKSVESALEAEMSGQQST